MPPLVSSYSTKDMKQIKDTLSLQLLREQADKTMPAGSFVWLYGSHARGNHHEGSDWDLLLLLDKKEINDDDFKQYGYPFILFGWQYGADVSPQLYTIQEWKQRQSTPFYNNVEHDKQIIYGARNRIMAGHSNAVIMAESKV